MAIFNKYPYSNFQELNLDWILQELKDLTDEWAVFENQYQGITAEAETVPYNDGASVNVTGGNGQPFNFDFKIPAGKDIAIYQYAITYGVSNDTATVPGTWTDTIPAVAPGQYLWTKITIQFTTGQNVSYYSVARQGSGAGGVASVNNIMPDNNGNVTVPLPQASNNNPLMDGISADAGLSSDFSRSDHVHPADTSKLDVMLGENGKKKVYAVEDASTEILLETTVNQSSASGKIPMYSTDDTIRTADPVGSYDAANKNYLINNYASLNDIANFVDFTDIATTATNGICRPDGTTLDINNLGQMFLKKGITVNLLWSNNNPNSSWSTQSITFDPGVNINDYMLVLVIFKHYTTIDRMIPVLCLAQGGTYEVFRTDFRNSYRPFTIAADGTYISVDNCTSFTAYNDSNSTTQTNSYIIPYYVFGIR